MGITDESVAEVRQRADIVKVASQFMQLKPSGRRWTGLCPFHGEKTPSFSVNAQENLFICFGCQAKGDVITFVRDIQHMDFVEAIEWLAAQSGVTLRYTEAGQGESRKRKTVLTEAVEAAVEWYHQRLLTGRDAGAARRYLRERGFDGDGVRRFRLGWAPDDWDALSRHLGLTDKVLVDSGLGFVNRARRQQDFFRGRVLFPIFDAQDNPIGFGGRKLPGDDGPKYRNTGQTALYDKSRVLYGLNWAKSDVVRAEEVIICEGYTDVIGFADVGIPRAVATCGTSLTEDHVRMLRRFARRLVLAFDPDAAGAAAAERVYAWEQAHELEIVVADLPSGQDPGDLARSDPDRLRAAVETPTPFLGFRVERALAAGRLDTPEGRARTAEAALDVIAEHPSDFVRDQYVMQVADRCRIDVERLREGLRPGSRTARRVPIGPAASRRIARSDHPELAALRLAADAEARATMLPLLHEVLFADDHHAVAFRALRDAGGDVTRAIEAADADTAELLLRVAVEEETGDPTDVRRMLLRHLGQREAEVVRAEVKAATTPEDMRQRLDVQRWLHQQLEAVGPDARSERATEDQLLTWLAERAEERS